MSMEEAATSGIIGEMGDDEISILMADYSMPFLSGNADHFSVPQGSLLTQSQYGKVVFHDIADSYPTDSDVCCRYSLTTGVEVQEGDFVAIFRVGWNNLEEALLKHPAFLPDSPLSSLGTRPGQVLFRADALPKDEQEFYQLCYVTAEGSVCGASLPFQFRRPLVEELCADESLEGDSDLVVVRSRTAVVEERLRKAVEDHEEIQREKQKLLCQVDETNVKLEQAKNENDDLAKELQVAKAEIQELKELIEAGKQRERQVTKLQQDMQVLDESRSQASAQLQHSQQHIEMLNATVETLSADKARMAGLLRESVRRADEIAQHLSNVQLQKKATIANLNEACEEYKKALATAENKHKLKIAEMEQALEQRREAERDLIAKLRAAEEMTGQNTRHEQEIALLRQHRENLESQVQVLDEENERRMNQLEQSRGRERELVTQVAELTKAKQLGAAIAVEAQTEPWLPSTDCDQCEAAAMQMSLLEAQVQNLCTRLDMGAEEYRKVYLEKHRMERKLSKTGTGNKKVATAVIESDSSQQNEPKSSTSAGPASSSSTSDSESLRSCPVCGITFPPDAGDLFTRHFEGHLS